MKEDPRKAALAKVDADIEQATQDQKTMEHRLGAARRDLADEQRKNSELVKAARDAFEREPSSDTADALSLAERRSELLVGKRAKALEVLTAEAKSLNDSLFALTLRRHEVIWDRAALAARRDERAVRAAKLILDLLAINEEAMEDAREVRFALFRAAELRGEQPSGIHMIADSLGMTAMSFISETVSTMGPKAMVEFRALAARS